MVSPIRPVTIGDLNPANGPSGLAAAGAATDTEAADATAATGFGRTVGDALSEVGQRENAAKDAAEAAAVGDLQSVNDYMIAATQAQLATEITVAVRDRAISAFNDIMRMQV